MPSATELPRIDDHMLRAVDVIRTGLQIGNWGASITQLESIRFRDQLLLELRMRAIQRTCWEGRRGNQRDSHRMASDCRIHGRYVLRDESQFDACRQAKFVRHL